MRHLYSERNALRPPDWRWERAKLAASGQLPADRARDDDWVHRAARFLAAAGQGGPAGYATAADVAALERRWPDVFWARHYREMADAAGADQPSSFAAAGHRHVAARWGLEARILGDESPADIARKTGIHADDVVAYERLYFDVRPRLDQEHYVHTQVLGPAIHRGLQARDYDLLWKLFGYQMGPEALDALVSTFPRARRRVPRDGVAGALAESIAFDVRRNMATWGKAARSERDGVAMSIVSAYQDLVKAEREAGGPGRADDQLSANLGAALEAIAFVVGPRPAADPAMAALDAAGVEPSGRELVALSLGGGPAVDPEILAAGFPEPSPRREA